MPTPTRKGIFLVLLAMCLVVAVAVIPDKFGVEYQRYLMVGIVLGLVVMLFFTTDFRKWLWPGAAKSKADRFNIPPGAATRRLINLAKAAISEAEPEKSLQHLSGLKAPALDTQVVALNGRYAEYRRNSRLGLLSTKEETLISNQIKHDILDLIKALEDELATGTENYNIIKEYLKKRYTNRLRQKLANRQPVNLRRLINAKVTPKGNRPAFVTYNSDEVSGKLLQTFNEARGRILLVGAPGAGKTTLLLQLVLELLVAEPDSLPVLLNLATWSKEYISLEPWLIKVLAAEMGISEKYAVEIIQQNRLIPLFDGFDEIRGEDRPSCLEAINRYGADTQRQYVISSRKKEYKSVGKAVLVHLPIEVCPLPPEQMKAELQRLWEHPDKPERGAMLLLDAIEKDALLQKAVQVPFYFNCLQILFNEGLTLEEMFFVAKTPEDRQAEILERFVEYEFKASVYESYPVEKICHWLSFLASRMTEQNIVVFELRDLQYGWWRWSKGQIILAYLVYGLVQGLHALVYGPGVGLATWLVAAPNREIIEYITGTLFAGLLVVVVVGPLTGLIHMLLNLIFNWQLTIKTRDNINWSWGNYIKNLKKDIIAGSTAGLIIGLTAGLVYGPIIGLTFGIIGGPMFRGLLSLLKSSTDILQITSPYHRFNASKKSLWFSILQHKFLCYQLRKQGLLPPDLVVFLNEMSLRHIMEFDGDPKTGEDGGSWRFRHRILQEYFDAQWKGPREHKKPENPSIFS